MVVTAFAWADALNLQPYGFIRANGVFSNRAMSSFGYPNLSAPTAVYPESAFNADLPESSFQLSQSRLGINLQSGDRLGGQVEIDFIDFSKSTPVQGANPRLRIANIHFKLTDNDELNLGQDWDIFSPGSPFTYNPVALYFTAGNAGYFRPQLRWAHHMSSLTFETALGMAGRNVSPSENDVEQDLVPSFAARLSYQLSPSSKMGISAIAGRLRFTTVAPQAVFREFYGLDVYYQGDLTDSLALRGAVYFGENLANSGALTLAMATAVESRHEAGGYLTLRDTFSPYVRLTLGVGGAFILEDGGSATPVIADSRIVGNLKGEAAIGYLPVPQLEFFLDDAQFATQYLGIASGQTYVLGGNVVEAGAVYTL